MIPRIIIIYGNIGAGKTTIAKELSKKLDYELIHFDNIMWTTTGRDNIYGDNDTFLLTVDETQKVYDSMHLIAKQFIQTKKGVILESLYFKKQREEAINIAKEGKYPYCIIEILADDNITEERLHKRKNVNPQSPGIKLFKEFKSWQEPEHRKHLVITNHGSLEQATNEIISKLEEYTIT